MIPCRLIRDLVAELRWAAGNVRAIIEMAREASYTWDDE